MILLQILTIFLLTIAFLINLYHWFLALYGLIVKTKKEAVKNNTPLHKFAIIIPAHNEEKLILRVLRSCFNLHYPKDKYKVIVIADNCTDHTAKLAIEAGALCLERHDEKNKGKNYALAWAFKQILKEKYDTIYDTILVLDADCVISPTALIHFNQFLVKGYKVLQANYAVSNPDTSVESYITAIGHTLESGLFYFPKSCLGLAVFLQGTGMIFHKEILRKYPWETRSIAEDTEYSIALFEAGIQIKFINDIKISTESPTQQKQLDIQRARWASGNINLNKKYALKLIIKGLLNRKWLLLDAGWTLLILSKPLILLELIIGLILSTLCWWLLPGFFSNILLVAGVSLTLMYICYLGLGIVILGLNYHRLKLLIKSPTVIMRLIHITLKWFFKKEEYLWGKTPR